MTAVLRQHECSAGSREADTRLTPSQRDDYAGQSVGRDNNGDDDVGRNQLKSPRQVYIYRVLRRVSLVKLECLIVLSVSVTDRLCLRTSERYAVV